MSTDKLISRESSLYWMGIATLTILLFHIGQNESTHIVHKCIIFVFSKGSIGVNIFFFLSGYGLANSFDKNTLKVFYMNRFKRLYPMMFFFMIASYFIKGGFSSMFLWDILKHATGISFWLKSVFPDWFVPCLSMIYILFPILFYFSRWLFEKNLALILLMIVLPVLAIIPLKSFNYTLFFPRIPMVFLGIMTFLAEQKENRNKLYVLLFYCALLSCTQLYKGAHLAVPAIILFFSYYNVHPFFSFLSFLGKHSLEIYLAQCLLVFNYDFSNKYFFNLFMVIVAIIVASILLYYSHSIFWKLLPTRIINS